MLVGQLDVMSKYPMADAIPAGVDMEKIRRVIQRKSLGGLANTTKWNELITAVRAREASRPSYRAKSVEGYVSGWDVEWFYHLPFPFVGVEWFDISLSSDDDGRINPDWIVELVNSIGFEFEVGKDVLRIWGYAPKNYEDFERRSHNFAFDTDASRRST
jgi:hypothetical protein